VLGSRRIISWLAITMDSHTVPEKLLKQFAFQHAKKGLRLWRYQKGREPYWDVSPHKATVIVGHFSDPRDGAREESIETRLNQQFENPVHDFIEQLSFRTFVLSACHTIALAPYIALLWHRSNARKAVTGQHRDLSIQALEKLQNRDDLLERIAASWTLSMVEMGWTLDAPVGKHKVVETIDNFIARFKRAGHSESSYADTMERVMTNQDNTFDGAHWGVVHTEPDKPFVIGDAPVVTWRRNRIGVLNYGVGFHEPDVEVTLPISPTACLHVLPNVQRALAVATPTASEINVAQAAFANACYTNVRSDSLNHQLQQHFGAKEMGVNAFSIHHKDYVTAFSVLISRMGPPPTVWPSFPNS
jgi:hypothetical protein